MQTRLVWALGVVLCVSAVVAMGSIDEDDTALEPNDMELRDQMSAIELLESQSRTHPTAESRAAARHVLLHAYADMAKQKHSERYAAFVQATSHESMSDESDEAEDSEAVSLVEDSGLAARESGSKSETDANAGAKLSPVDTPQNLVGAPRMTPACRRQLHNYLTDCVFDGKSADANKPNCYQIYAVWARDCFNGGIMPSEKADE